MGSGTIARITVEVGVTVGRVRAVPERPDAADTFASRAWDDPDLDTGLPLGALVPDPAPCHDGPLGWALRRIRRC